MHIDKFVIQTPLIKIMVNGLEFEANEYTIRNLQIAMFNKEIESLSMLDDNGNWINCEEDGRWNNTNGQYNNLKIFHTATELLIQLYQLQNT